MSSSPIPNRKRRRTRQTSLDWRRELSECLCELTGITHRRRCVIHCGRKDVEEGPMCKRRRISLVVVLLVLLSAPLACGPGVGRGQPIAVSRNCADGGPQDISYEAVDADVLPDSEGPLTDDTEAPRIAVPRFDEEPLTTVSLCRPPQVTVSGEKLSLNGNLQAKRITISWTKNSLKHRGRDIPDGSEIEADGAITIDKVGSFPGRLILHHAMGHILVVNEVTLERYIQGVVGNEVPARWPAEVKKAQAVAARTYALARMALKESPYALESTVMDQVYRGHPPDKGVVAAVRATRGEVLIQANGLIEAKYHSTCGGHTENVDEVWPELMVHHQWAVACTTCSSSPTYRWSTVLTYGELTRALKTVHKGLKRIKGLSATNRSPTGRVRTLEVHTQKGSFEISARDFRRIVNLRKIRSTHFEIEAQPRSVKLNGRGFGHGAGMCQWGAYGMAKAGHSYADILAHYYRGSTIHEAYE